MPVMLDVVTNTLELLLQKASSQIIPSSPHTLPEKLLTIQRHSSEMLL